MSLKFKILADCMPQKVCITDINGKVTYVNNRWLEYTQKKAKNLYGFYLKSLIHADDLDLCEKNWKQCKLTGKDFELEIRFLFHNGTYQCHLSRGIAQRDKENKITQWIFTQTNIEENKKLAEKLRRTNFLSTNIIENSPDCIKVINKEGCIIYMNLSGFRLLETQDLNLIIDKPWVEFWENEDKEKAKNAIKEAFLGNNASFQASMKTFKGTIKWWDVLISPISNSDSAITQLISVSRDITERKREELQKDQFISIVSHEMKTPLTSTKAYLQLLEIICAEDNETKKLYVKKGIDSAEKLSQLITVLIDTNKIQNGKLEYSLTNFDFNEMVISIVEDIALISPSHSVIINGKALKLVTGDRDRLKQVITNLLNNAIKYSPLQNQIFMEIQQINNDLMVSIKDKGIGIGDYHLQKIFEKYYRVEDLPIRFQGLGLGLFISNEIVQRHNGRLWAESETGKGSTFSFTIPN